MKSQCIIKHTTISNSNIRVMFWRKTNWPFCWFVFDSIPSNVLDLFKGERVNS